MLKTFPRGGIHPPECKISKSVAIEVLPVPASVVIPLAQHIGAPAVTEVAKGDRVVVGQVIGKAGGFVSAAVHSSVSGVVQSVDSAVGATGVKIPAVTIAVEGDNWLEGIDRSNRLVTECRLNAKEIVEKIAAAGIVGMGGATFPTQVKLSPPPGKRAEILIINGVECEPYLTSDHRVMLERSAEILVGVGLLARALEVEKVYVGVENNKPDAIAKLREVATELVRQLPVAIEIVPLKVRYPQGGEKQLITAITGRVVPSCALPIDVGCVVQNVGTALAVYEAVQKNKPLVERVVTVTGKDMAQPSNLLVRIGTPVSVLLEAGGMVVPSGEPLKVIGGGPMMGRAMSNVDAPVTKGTSGILVLSGRDARRHTETACIKCGKCVTVCPMGLEPYLLAPYVRRGMFDYVEQARVVDCIECGSCAYTCPARLPLLDWIRLGKAEVNKIIRARLNC